jgi:hypothetical protein
MISHHVAMIGLLYGEQSGDKKMFLENTFLMSKHALCLTFFMKPLESTSMKI